MFHPRLNLKDFINPEDSVTKIASMDVVSCFETKTLAHAIDLFLGNKRKYRRLPVVNKNNQLKGIITVIDILSYLIGKEVKSFNTRVSAIMEKNVYFLEDKTSIKQTIKLFHHYKKGAYPILKNNKVFGILSEFDFLKLIKKPTKIKVSEIMKKPIIAKEEWPVSDVAKMLCKGGFRRLPVVKNKILTGIIVPHDIVFHLEKNKKLLRIKAEKTETEKIMERNVITISPEKDVFEAVKIMRSKRIGGLPVTEDRELVGILTERDVLNLFR